MHFPPPPQPVPVLTAAAPQAPVVTNTVILQKAPAPNPLLPGKPVVQGIQLGNPRLAEEQEALRQRQGPAVPVTMQEIKEADIRCRIPVEGIPKLFRRSTDPACKAFNESPRGVQVQNR
ncbi:MAG: hypothetical protein PW734_10795 [Verrucomicrobium sp.]|nr:hypothetical protein [Verrucomicrobium sp.]